MRSTSPVVVLRPKRCSPSDATAEVLPFRLWSPDVLGDCGDRCVEGWLAARGWQSFPFQREVWDAIAQGRGGMLHATTGSGTTASGSMTRSR